MTENQLASLALDVAFEMHRQYGPGLFERVYEEFFCYELNKRGIEYKRQFGIPLLHEEIKMEVCFIADVILENKLIIELKSVESLSDLHYKQLLTYLKLSGIKLGLLINFNTALLKNGIRRIANNL
jgi:GxxExxY protein